MAKKSRAKLSPATDQELPVPAATVATLMVDKSPALFQTTRNLDVVLHYWGWYMSESEWPRHLVLATCALAWPNRRFRLHDELNDPDVSPEDLITLRDVVDADTGESAAELFDDHDKTLHANRPKQVRSIADPLTHCGDRR